MQFSIDFSSQSQVAGWVVLENPGDIPTFLIEVADRPVIELPANVMRKDLKELGYHATGQAGFQVDETIIEDIESVPQFVIREKTTKIEVYRRYPTSDYINKKMFLYIFSVLHKMNILKRVTKEFASCYINIEKFPFETTNAILGSRTFESLACIGHPSFKRYAAALDQNDFFKAVLLNDPLNDLAEKLLLLRLIARSKNRAILESHLSAYLPLISFAEQLDFNDSRSLRSAFRNLAPEQRNAISNPMVKIFACDIDEVPQRRHVGLALEYLASMDIVGTTSNIGVFHAMFNQMLDADIMPTVSNEPGLELDGTKELALKLSRISTVTKLIEHDLALYSYVEDAIQEGLAVNEENAT